MTDLPESAGLPWNADERARARYPRSQFWLHLRPARLPRASMRWTHTFGLGGSSLVLLLILASTGALQLLVYQPATSGAWQSVRALETSVGFGSLIRGMHYWSANLLIVVMGLHLMRVLLTNAFRRERAVNWWIGLGLFVLVLAVSFTGYLLPFDQRAWWAVTISTRMLDLVPFVGPSLRELALGAQEIGDVTLVRFATFHTTVLPILLAGFAAWHFWRVRRAGGVILPKNADATDRLTFFPHLFVRELAQATVILAAIVVLAVSFGAPLGDPANPGLSPNPVKAPWYFVGLQELLIHLHPIFALVAVPLGALGFAIALPRMPERAWPVRVVLGLTVVYLVLTLTGVWFRGENMALTWPGLS
jgi:quinol-cytochrome oxidoreductase complex cytochrome b subunit